MKEEDKNILLGDTYEAPVTQQFAGFGNIFIMPDQASVAAAYNANNPLNSTTDLGVTPRHEGDTGSVEVFWPCVGTSRIVPDYMSLFPQSGQNAPFAGATRPLCDRKEVTLEDQMSVLAKFYVFTSTHITSHYTGIITDDFTSEFDPFSPAFGEKFSPANLPVSVKDWAGNETSRVLSDQHGIFNGLTYSSFSVNPPDPSGYIPTMMTMCMNDRGSGATPDPFYQDSYSQFCYEWSFMPGQTSHLDTPVIPTAAFAPNYNHPDCAYPDATPAILRVDGDGVGPWVSAAGNTLTITALGDQVVNNNGYSGPSATTPPYNQKTITRHYGFGGTQGTVSIGGIAVPAANITTWSDTSIVLTVPAGVPSCAVQQQLQYGGSAAQCGELAITAANGKQSVDAVTVTIGGKAPTRVAAGQTIQSVIDAASPGDLIIVPPGNYHELLLMWKPVRLQGVGAASSIMDANAHPSGLLLTEWRQRVVCLFGIAPTGVPDGYNPGCASSFGSTWTGFQPTTSNPQVDRLPLEAVVGWDAGLNGNLAEQLQEPSLMGAYEGAGITVLGKGVRVPPGTDPWTDGTEASAYPANAELLTGTTNATTGCGANTASAHNPFPSNFGCNPSRIDGLSFTNSSQGGGGIFVHAWAHNLEIANNRIHNNQGTLSGGITIGQGEHPGVYTQGGTNSAPGSCQTSLVANIELPYCFDTNVNVHHNAVTMNASEGDELFAATPSGAGGVAICTGADNYNFNYNWVCGNMSTGDGGGVSHMGFMYNGSIQHNSILFNQSTNPTTPSNGGGLLIMSAPDTDPTCPGEPDADCAHAYGTVGDGVGPGLVVNANLIMGNAAEAGSGGGIRFQGVNGVEVSTFPTTPARWHSVAVTNNIIANNVAGWDGGGVSFQDSINVNLINNTIVSNDSTASSGSLFGAFFAPQASAPTPCGRDAIGASLRCVPLSTPQVAGVASAGHSAEFLASLPATITCPPGHPLNPTNAALGVSNGACRTVSFPTLYNDVIWQNRAFHIDVIQPASGSGQQQATVSLVPQLSQPTTGACVAPQAGTALYWDIGLRGDTGATDHSSGVTLQPKGSVLTNITGYGAGPGTLPGNTSNFSPGVVTQYCNGSKIPPEAGQGAWYQVPPGTNEVNIPVPVFSLTAGATVDEGNNWVNISWGPLSLINPTTEITPSTEAVLGDYTLAAGSPAINFISLANPTGAPLTDFFGNARPAGSGYDIGAVEFGALPPVVTATLTPATWTVSQTRNCPGTTGAQRLACALDPAQLFTLRNTGNVPLTGITNGVLGGANTNEYVLNPLLSTCGPAGGGQLVSNTTLAPNATCVVSVQFKPLTAQTTGLKPATVSVSDSAGTQTSALNGTAR